MSGKKEMEPGLPDFSWYNIPKLVKCTKMAIKYTNIMQDPPKFTKIKIFGSKRNHLATLNGTRYEEL
jgi:hypothetical protein